MEELIRLVQQNVGISADQAKAAITTVAGFLKDRLPEPIGSQIESALSGTGGGLAEGLGGLARGLGGMMGDKPA